MHLFPQPKPTVMEDTVLAAPVTVYRVEMPNGNGPYNSDLPAAEEIYARLCFGERGTRLLGATCWNCADLAVANNETMDNAAADFHHRFGHANFACDSLDAIKAWFPEGARRYLRDEWGARLIVYTVPAGQHLRTLANGEVVFSKPDATRTGTLDLVTLK